MALKAGYYGLKKKMVDKLTKLTGIYSIGSGLNLSSAGALSVKNATTSQKGIVQLDEVPTDGSSNVPTSDGVYDALATKQNVLTFDDEPTSLSTNPVKSGGVYDAIQDVSNFYKEVRTGRFEFDNSNLSSPVEVTFDTPWEEFTASSVVFIILQFEGGNSTYVYTYSIGSVYQTRFTVLIKNINNDVSASTRAAKYTAFILN